MEEDEHLRTENSDSPWGLALWMERMLLCAQKFHVGENKCEKAYHTHETCIAVYQRPQQKPMHLK